MYYLICTIVTVGYGDITASSKSERLYASFLILIGTWVYTLLISMFSRITTNST
jgi:hypothetical protein